LLAPSGERVSLAQLCKIKVTDGASEVYREGNRRYVAIKYSVRGRDLGSTVEEAIKKVNDQVKLPPGYTIELGGRIRKPEAGQRAACDCAADYDSDHLHHSLHDVQILQMGDADHGEHRHCADWRFAGAVVHRNKFQRFFRSGFLALFGVSRADRSDHARIHQPVARAAILTVEDAAVEGAVLRLRPIMMTMLVATLGLLPAALSHAIGSDSQRPFAIVIVGGLIAALVMSIFLLPTLYVWIAGERDVLRAS
jgi:cobalt-zinc-cadmium resistance protein CzcA